MAAPSAGERAAKADRMDQAASDRMLSKTMRDSSQPASVRIAAAKEQQNRRDTPGYINGRGIRDAEQNRNQDSQTADNFTKEGLRLQGKENSADVVAGQADAANSTAKGVNQTFPSTAPLKPGDPVPAAPAVGAGIAPPTTDENGFVSAPSEPVGQGATDPATTPPVATGGAVSGKPAVPDWRQERAAGLDAQKKQFAIEKFGKDIIDWTVNDPEDQGKKSAQIFKYGESLGISPEQIEAQADKARNGQVAEAKEKSKYTPSKETLDMESKFDAMIADRPADQKAMFSKMSEKDKAAMVQKNESLKMVREEEAKLGPDKNSNAEQAKALIPGAKKEVSDLVSALDSASNSFMDPMGDIEFQVDQMRESRGALDERASTEIGDKLQSEVVPDNVKAARETLAGLDGGGWNLAKGQEMLDQQANANKPSPTKEVVPRTTDPASETKPFVDENKGPLGSLLSDAGRFFSDHQKKVNEGQTERIKAQKTESLDDYGKKLAFLDLDIEAFENDYKSSSSQTGALSAKNKISTWSNRRNEVYSEILKKHEKGEIDATSLIETNPQLKEIYLKSKSPDQASIDNKLQQREAAYRAPIDEVLGRNEFLKRFSLGDPVPT